MSPKLHRFLQALKLTLGFALLLALVFLVDGGGTLAYLQDAQLIWLAFGLLISLTLLAVYCAPGVPDDLLSRAAVGSEQAAVDIERTARLVETLAQ